MTHLLLAAAAFFLGFAAQIVACVFAAQNIASRHLAIIIMLVLPLTLFALPGVANFAAVGATIVWIVSIFGFIRGAEIEEAEEAKLSGTAQS